MTESANKVLDRLRAGFRTRWAGKTASHTSTTDQIVTSGSESEPMGRLTDLLAGGGGNFSEIWNSTTAADEFGPVPQGVYVCHITRGTLGESRQKKTPAYKLEFTVIEGSHIGRRLWLDLWLTPLALPASKRDLAKIGITEPDQMTQSLPRGIRCRVTVVVRTGDDGIPRNRVTSFDFVALDALEEDPFAPMEPDSSATDKVTPSPVAESDSTQPERVDVRSQPGVDQSRRLRR